MLSENRFQVLFISVFLCVLEQRNFITSIKNIMMEKLLFERTKIKSRSLSCVEFYQITRYIDAQKPVNTWVSTVPADKYLLRLLYFVFSRYDI